MIFLNDIYSTLLLLESLSSAHRVDTLAKLFLAWIESHEILPKHGPA